MKPNELKDAVQGKDMSYWKPPEEVLALEKRIAQLEQALREIRDGTMCGLALRTADQALTPAQKEGK